MPSIAITRFTGVPRIAPAPPSRRESMPLGRRVGVPGVWIDDEDEDECRSRRGGVPYSIAAVGREG